MAVDAVLPTPVMKWNPNRVVPRIFLARFSIINIDTKRKRTMVSHHNSVVLAVVNVDTQLTYMNLSATFPDYVF